jgi:uncharacterized membrane protein YhaH (DUF805 family)
MNRRVGAGTYTLSMSLAVISWSLATIYVITTLVPNHHLTATDLNLYVGVFGAIVGLIYFPLSIGRARDLNFSPWISNLLALPFFAVMILPLFCFLSGPRWTNDYGDPPNPSGFLKVTLAFVLFGVAITLCYAALKMFYVTRYQLASAL